MRPKTRGQGGFTLLELMIVIMVISIIAAIAIPNFMESRRAAHQKAAVQRMRQIFAAQEDFKRKFGRYADSIPELVTAKMLGDPFVTGSTLLQRVGPFAFGSTVPEFYTVDGDPLEPEANAQTRFRIAVQPDGATLADRARNCDFMMFTTEDGKMWMHRVQAGCTLNHAMNSAKYVDDLTFASTYEPLNDTGN